MTPVPTAPPSLASRLVRLAVRDERWRAVTEGDLLEEFAARSAERGARRARAWYWRQAVSLVGEAASGAIAGFFRPAGGLLMTTLVRECRFALRSLARQPLVTTLIVLTIALGLGANAATFGMIDALALRPFTFQGVDRLVVLSELSPANPYPQEEVSPGNLRDLEGRSFQTLDVLAGIESWDVNLSGGDQPERVQGSRVSSTFFDMLGQKPDVGTFFTKDAEAWGRHRVAVISHGLWARRFGSDPTVVGRAVRINGEVFDVTGIARPGFDFPAATEVWSPLAFSPEDAADRAAHYLTVVGHLRPGATRESAQAEMAQVYAGISRDFPDPTRDRDLVVSSFSAAMTDFALPQILGLWQVAAILVLVIACVNVTNLLLARGVSRQRELAVRLAIGAGRGQIVRQLLVEAVVIAVISVPAALGVAWLFLAAIRTSMPAAIVKYLPGWVTMGVDWRVAGVTFAASLAAAFLFGLLPAIQVSRPQLTATLRDGGRTSTSAGARGRLRRGLVVAQIALALPLLVMSGLAAIGAHRFGSGPQGFDPDNVVRLRMLLPEALYADADARRDFAERLVEHAGSIPRAEIVATTSVTPSATAGSRRGIVVDGVTPPEGDLPLVNYRAVSAGYFATMRVPIERGRAIEGQDGPSAQRAAVVSASMARRYWPDGSPIGRRVKVGRETTDWLTVVGVAGDTIDDWFQYRNEPTMYVSMRQAPTSQVFLVARSIAGVAPELLVPELRAAVAAVDRGQPVFDAVTMRAAIHERTTGLRFIGGIMAAFGGLALILAGFGIYGLMANYVAQRRQEIGVRLALGASTRDVLRLTLGHSAKLATIGIVIGLALGLALARLMETMLFGVVAIEPSLFVAITLGLSAVAFIASLIPARQAAKIDPIATLR